MITLCDKHCVIKRLCVLNKEYLHQWLLTCQRQGDGNTANTDGEMAVDTESNTKLCGWAVKPACCAQAVGFIGELYSCFFGSIV